MDGEGRGPRGEDEAGHPCIHATCDTLQLRTSFSLFRSVLRSWNLTALLPQSVETTVLCNTFDHGCPCALASRDDGKLPA